MTEETLTPQKRINLFLLDLCHGEAAFDDAPSYLSEDQILNLKVALIDGWQDIQLFSTTATKYSFVGTNERLKGKYGCHIPDYANDLNAVVLLCESANIKWSACRDAAQANLGDIIVIEHGKNAPLALCNLLLKLDFTGTTLERPEVVRLHKEIQFATNKKLMLIDEEKFDEAANYRDQEMALHRQLRILTNPEPEIKVSDLIEADFTS